MPLLESIRRAGASLMRPELRLAALLAAMLSLAALAALAGFTSWAVWRFNWLEQWPWAEWVLNIAAGAGALVAAWLMFPFLMPLVASLWMDKALAMVEAEYGADGREPGLWRSVREGIGFAIKALLLNMLTLPFYLLPGVNMAIYVLLNGWLMGREFMDAVLMRQVEAGRMKAERRRWRGASWRAGMALAAMTWLPVVNLLLPLLGVCMMAHFYHLTKRGG